MLLNRLHQAHWPCCLLLVTLISACGVSPGQNCDLEIASIVNGDNLPTQSTEWDCQQQNSFFSFGLFNDNTGFNSTLGKFTWQDQGCGKYTYSTPLGNGQVSDLSLSADSRQLHYTDNFQGQFSSVFCTLDETPDNFSF